MSLVACVATSARLREQCSWEWDATAPSHPSTVEAVDGVLSQGFQTTTGHTAERKIHWKVTLKWLGKRQAETFKSVHSMSIYIAIPWRFNKPVTEPPLFFSLVIIPKDLWDFILAK